MIDMVKNRERLEQEKRKFEGRDSYEKYEKNFKQLLLDKEDDPEFEPLIREYRETDAWLNRYSLREMNTRPEDRGKEEAEEAWGKVLFDTREYDEKLLRLREEIINKYYKQILTRED